VVFTAFLSPSIIYFPHVRILSAEPHACIHEARIVTISSKRVTRSLQPTTTPTFYRMQQTQRHALGVARPIFPCSKTLSAPASSSTETSQLPQPQFKFICFPQLPKELQLQIWRATLPGPRVVKIRYSGVGEDARCTSKLNGLSRLESP
jgi:hypothetical protein